MNNAYIMHSGTKGMKWYQRLYQYKDGSLTPLGRIHYGVGPPRGSRNSVPAESTQRNSKSEENRQVEEPPKKRTFKELSPADQHEVMKDALARIKAKDDTVYSEFTIEDIKAIIDRADQEARLEKAANPEQNQNSQNNQNKDSDKITTYKDNKPIEAMTDQELKERLQRVNSEIQYLEKTKKPSKYDKLKKALGIAKEVGQNVKDAQALYSQYEALKKALAERQKASQQEHSSQENTQASQQPKSKGDSVRETVQTATGVVGAAAAASRAFPGATSAASSAAAKGAGAVAKAADVADNKLAKLLATAAAVGVGAATLKYVGSKSLLKAADKVAKVSTMAVPALINSVGNVADIGKISNFIFK